MEEFCIDRNFPPVIYACDFSVWKKPIVRQFFSGSRVEFVHSASQVPDGSTLLVWGRNVVKGNLLPEVRLLHLEDGFLRSVGLGADLVRPVSWVVDSKGIYYDATRPSDLEEMLQTTEFSAEILERASSLRDSIVKAGLTKYNVGQDKWQRPKSAERVILVPGQVESDASLKYGAPGIHTNLELLRNVRESNPDAYILYKPHPDVVAGLRRSGQEEDSARNWCDEMLIHADMGELLQQVDEVHTLTSLAGFEALLRGKKVTCYGQPFYAGWSLTTDIIPVQRRERHLSIDMLVAGALILYPIYISRKTGSFTSPENVIAELLSWRASNSDKLPAWSRVYRFIIGKILRKP